jgi:hypothetical protein
MNQEVYEQIVRQVWGPFFSKDILVDQMRAKVFEQIRDQLSDKAKRQIGEVYKSLCQTVGRNGSKLFSSMHATQEAK